MECPEDNEPMVFIKECGQKIKQWWCPLCRTNWWVDEELTYYPTLEAAQKRIRVRIQVRS